MSKLISKLIAQFPIISDQISKKELETILSILESTLNKCRSGAVIEMGCYIGTTSIFITRLLAYYGGTLEYHVYDSFMGLPEKTINDNSVVGEQFKVGELLATKKQFINNFKKAGLKLPTIHKAWFNDLDQKDIPKNVSFAFLDGDFYESIKTSLQLITPNLVEGAVIVVDDYNNEALPGAKRALDEWVTTNKYVVQNINSLGVVYT